MVTLKVEASSHTQGRREGHIQGHCKVRILDQGHHQGCFQGCGYGDGHIRGRCHEGVGVVVWMGFLGVGKVMDLAYITLLLLSRLICSPSADTAPTYTDSIFL